MADQDKSTGEVVDEEELKIESVQPELSDEVIHEDIKSSDSRNELAHIEKPKNSNIFKQIWSKYTARKKIAIPLTILILLAVLMGIPVTRYLLLGTFIKHDVKVNVSDIKTLTPISGVEVSIHGQSAKTDGDGNATIKAVKVGKAQLKATKKYYKDFTTTITVTIKEAKGAGSFRLEATGRQVPVRAVNKISGKSIKGVLIKVKDAEAQTDQNGDATLVLPADRSDEAGTLSGEGFNNLPVKIIISQTAVKENTFTLTPKGKLYFLSKQTGKIDVVKTDLDGANRQIVLSGTGKEEDRGTVLLATRDWKYLALQSRREGDKAQLYLIDTSNDKLTEIDSGDATFTPVGWDNHSFVYKVTRNNFQPWQPKNTALKTYSADNLQLTTIDETAGEGTSFSDYAAESLESVYIAKNNVVYIKQWQSGYLSAYRLAGKRTNIYAVKPNGTAKQVLKDFDAGATGYISAVASEPDEIYFSVNNNIAPTAFYEYKNDKVSEDKTLKAEDFTKFYPTYLLSPGGQNTFWHEPRDGKNTLFIGQPDGANGKEVASLSEYIPYGWYSDQYLLVSKGGSELYILPQDKAGDKSNYLKVTDYHKPDATFRGYGGGYGGQ